MRRFSSNTTCLMYVAHTTHLISNALHGVYEPLHNTQQFDNGWKICVEGVLELGR